MNADTPLSMLAVASMNVAPRLRGTRTRVSAVFLAASLVATAFPAFAQPATGPAPTPMQIQTAKEHFEHGLKLLDRAEFKNDPTLYEQAYLDFVRAWATYKTNTVLWNLAISAAHTKRTVEALGYFHDYDRRVHVLADPKHPDRKVLVQYFAQLNAQTAHVNVEADPGETVSLDGKVIGTSPLVDAVDILPGRHVFKAGKQSADLELAAGTVATAKLKSPAPPQTVTSAIVPDPAPASNAPPPIVSAPASSLPPDAETTSVSPRRLWLTVGLGTASAVLLTSAIIFGKKSSDAGRDADDIRARLSTRSCPCADLDDALHSAHTDHVASTVLFITSGVAAVGAVGAWFLLPDDKRPTTTATPLLGPGLVGAQWTTRF